ncbi:transposase [Agromyces mediolanus]|uniref:transposase n=1 Tax=Agromyces mediolanus TaxID=41986 RepID=UPI00203E04FC|nr:transposase [Agromyces mediolanus]MCM3657654.1 transposase [Agromyces mediolanus]
MADREALAEIAGELYAQRPADFVAARNARVTQLKPEDPALAAAVAELRRPAPAAWLVNQLVRHRWSELEQLLELGAELQAAQAELDAAALTTLARQRRTVVTALAREAGSLADELGAPVRQPVLDEVAGTLQAAMTDASAADAVRSGLLVRALEAVGTEVDLDGAVAGGLASAGSAPASARRPAAPPDELAERRTRKHQEARARAERELADAEARADAAERGAAEATELVDAASAAAGAAAATRDALLAERRELERRLCDAEGELARAEQAVPPLERNRARAARAASEARAAVDALRAGPAAP